MPKRSWQAKQHLLFEHLRDRVRPPFDLRVADHRVHVLGKRHLRVLAVDVGGRGGDDLRTRLGGCLGDDLRPEPVDHQRLVRVCIARDLVCREMDDDVASVRGLADRGLVADVRLAEVERGMIAEAGDVQTRPLRQVVETDDGVVATQELCDEIRPDEPRCTGDQDPHARVPRWRRGQRAPFAARSLLPAGLALSPIVLTGRGAYRRFLCTCAVSGRLAGDGRRSAYASAPRMPSISFTRTTFLSAPPLQAQEQGISPFVHALEDHPCG